MNQQTYLFGFALLVLSLLFIWVYVSDTHKELSKRITEMFKIELDKNNLDGVKFINIDYITHDEDLWYYQGKSTCVAYSPDTSSVCDYKISVCSGGVIPNTTSGDILLQVKNVVRAIISPENIHKNCPLVYSGVE